MPDLAKFPELCWLDRFDIAMPVALGVAMYGLGAPLQHVAPPRGTSGGQMLAWGFFVSTIVLLHATVTIDSLAHHYGSRHYAKLDRGRGRSADCL